MKTTGTRPKIIIPSANVRAERQRLEDERSAVADASSVRYSTDTDTLTLAMRSGITLTIPRSLIDELAVAHRTHLNELALNIGGDALSIPSLDVDIAISGLLRDLLGLNIQRMGGRARSEAKSAASRANGAKGGRPRKNHAA